MERRRGLGRVRLPGRAPELAFFFAFLAQLRCRSRFLICSASCLRHRYMGSPLSWLKRGLASHADPRHAVSWPARICAMHNAPALCSQHGATTTCIGSWRACLARQAGSASLHTCACHSIPVQVSWVHWHTAQRTAFQLAAVMKQNPCMDCPKSGNCTCGSTTCRWPSHQCSSQPTATRTCLPRHPYFNRSYEVT